MNQNTQNQQTNLVDYAKEMELLKANEKTNTYLPFWKPEEGRYLLKFLGEAKIRTQTINNELKTFADCDLQVDDGKFCWSMNKAVSSKKSAWYQVCQMAANNKGKLAGVECQIIVVGNKKSRQYTLFR